MNEPLVYLNDWFLPERLGCLALNDAGFIWGATITDLCRTFAHKPFRLGDHVRRFRQSCRTAGIPMLLAEEELANRAERLITHNASLLAPEDDLALVLFATPGLIGYYLGEPGGPGDGDPTLGMHTFRLPFSRYQRLFRDGAVLVVPSVRQLPPECVDPRIKHRSRLFWWIAEQEVRRIDPQATALLSDASGQVTETATANFLLVRDGVVLSPPHTAILEGVSLRTVEELCAELGIEFREQPLSLHDCLNADEALLAGTTYCLAPVRRINGVELRWPPVLHEHLLDAWSRRVGVRIGAQILASSEKSAVG
jgi:branched-chain amino acid aminotransferase